MSVDGQEAHIPGHMVLISGPSGCGKSTIIQRLISDDRVEFSVSATTRLIREGEVEGVDYHFLTAEQFRSKVEEGAFIEYAEVYGNLYGTLRAPMEAAITAGRVFLVEIDVQGALQLRALGESGVYVFISPPSFEELQRRLVGRGTESPEVLERRLKKAEDEYRERVKYDHIVINDELDLAVQQVRVLAGLEEASA